MLATLVRGPRAVFTPNTPHNRVTTGYGDPLVYAIDGRCGRLSWRPRLLSVV